MAKIIEESKQSQTVYREKGKKLWKIISRISGRCLYLEKNKVSRDQLKIGASSENEAKFFSFFK